MKIGLDAPARCPNSTFNCPRYRCAISIVAPITRAMFKQAAERQLGRYFSLMRSW